MAPSGEQILPSGLVSFVFTDIEASTALLRQLGESTAATVFERHRVLLREAIDAHHGIELGVEGDSFFVVFEEVNDAIRACVDAQRALADEPWPMPEGLRVRMGVHAGIAAPRGSGYVSVTVHQASRVMSAGHGGQILLSASAFDLAASVAGCAIESLGRFRIRDFDELTEIFRVDPVGLPVNDTPIRATPATNHNLVKTPTTFIGRDADLVAVNAMIGPGELVTVVGTGGVGKTRLAVEVGITVADEWRDGVWIAELAETRSPDLLPETIARAVGAPPSQTNDQWQIVLGHLASRNALVVLDNAEHLIDRVADLVLDLRRNCPQLSLLVTSREPLQLPGEQLFRLQPLASNGRTPAADSAAVELFVDRALSVGAAIDPTSDADVIAAICQRVDGLPLAIEIAAARTATLSLDEIHRGLLDRFRMLHSKSRALPNATAP